MTLRGCRIEHAQIVLQDGGCTGTFSLVENIAAEREILLDGYACASSSGSGTYSNRSPG